LERAVRCLLILTLAFVAAQPLLAADRPRIQVDSYVINAELQPEQHRLVARAQVKFTALDDIAIATFELHNALRPTRVTDATGKLLQVERVTQDSTIRVPLPAGLAKGQRSVLNFDYEGVLLSGDDSPVQGLKLAYVGDDTSYLLYAGRWFPMVGYGTDRFTATISVSVPSNWTVIASGKETPGMAKIVQTAAPEPAPEPATTRGRRTKRPAAAPAVPKEAPFPLTPGYKQYTFTWDKPSFPGTLIAGVFEPSIVNGGGVNLRLYFKPDKKNFFSSYADTAEKEFQFFSSLYGAAPSSNLTVVQLPDDTVPMAWAPEIAALAGRSISEKVNYRLLADSIAHQWWGASVSPATRDDWWLSDGFARYAEARYTENVAGKAAMEEAAKDMAVGALAYDTVPLSRVASLDTFSPEYQSLVTDKGAIILHMLRWVLGDANYENTVRQFATQYAGKPANVADLQAIAEKNYGDKLTWFFTQWLDSTGAPDFKDKYTIYRLGNNKGFRVVGEISQDLDLFRMPVELKIDTDGKTELKRIEVVGTNSAYSIETFGKPRRITIDPDERVLENSPDLKVRTAIMRGQQLVQQGDLAGALQEFQKSLDSNKNSSLAQYRIAEVFFLQHNYQAAANAYRESLNGDDEPKWTEVWSHIQLGKIFDLTGQRERAVNEYRQALQTNDNTQGAMDEARKFLQAAYNPEKSNSPGESASKQE
jgi:hypothetical protein